MKLIALGSNLPSAIGSPVDNIRNAEKQLTDKGFAIITRAPLYMTAPVPLSDQPDFVNTVMQVEFSDTPEAALDVCHRIEREMGRTRHIKNEARVIDIDIIAWDNVVQAGPPRLPHPHMHERAFVIVPLFDITPEWYHPILGKTAMELKSLLPNSDIRLSAAQW